MWSPQVVPSTTAMFSSVLRKMVRRGMCNWFCDARRCWQTLILIIQCLCIAHRYEQLPLQQADTDVRVGSICISAIWTFIDCARPREEPGLHPLARSKTAKDAYP